MNQIFNSASQKGTLFIIAAPSGAGKTSLVKTLLEKDPNICVSISHTTRAKRPLEQDGKDYHFVSIEQFNVLLKEHAFLEHAEVFGNHYGTSKHHVEELLSSGMDVILEIDWQGARQVRQLMPGTLSIFILPPSMNSLKERLSNRAQDSESVIAKRMEQAVDEMSHHGEFDFLVINDDFDEASHQLLTIIQCARLQTSRQKDRYHNLITDLLTSGTKTS